MKRFRHYNKGTAIVLCCFGSVNQQAKYQALQDQFIAQFDCADVFMALSSRSVLKKLDDPSLKTLAEQLASLDRAGYRRICVVSCYLFPTDEHQQVCKTIEGFKAFSLAKIDHTPAVIHQVKNANRILAALNTRYPCGDDEYNLFIYHGAPNLSAPGYSSIWYAESLLNQMSERNLTCSLEGAHPYSLIADTLKRKLGAANKVRIIPLLLVSGNHFQHDVKNIAAELALSTQVEMAEPISGDRFCLIDLAEVQQTLMEQTSQCLIQLGETQI
ncbi:sirohydrochlorin cobaltochelatase [Shewanella benthica]|uniref:Cobalt chelatase n=1 Tax=Shewanella benthica KT99 TaxID=314608 RepID=A9D3E0_9GAMM|nr:sirohydrochlorin cobaltochelatase [Shewanella benthica]EDQ01670.1 cobalt chelatase [Shewanella benthica KT99]